MSLKILRKGTGFSAHYIKEENELFWSNSKIRFFMVFVSFFVRTVGVCIEESINDHHIYDVIKNDVIKEIKAFIMQLSVDIIIHKVFKEF